MRHRILILCLMYPLLHGTELGPKEIQAYKAIEEKSKNLRKQRQLLGDKLKKELGEAQVEERKQIDTKISPKLRAFQEKESQSRRALIQRFQTLVPRLTLDNPERPEILLAFAMALFEQQEDEAFLGGDPNYVQIVEICETLERDHPQFVDMDKLYHVWGAAQWAEKNQEQAVAVWEKLIKKYPKSLYRDEILFRLGNYYVDNNEYAEAIDYYKQLVQNQGSSLYEQSLYRIGFLYYVQNRFKEAADYFSQILDYSQNNKKALLSKEAAEYLAICFAENENFSDMPFLKPNQIETGEAYFLRLRSYFHELKRKPYERMVYLELSRQLIELGMEYGSRRAILQAIYLKPTDPSNVELWEQLAQDYREYHPPEDLGLEWRSGLVASLGPKSKWFDSNTRLKNIKALEKARGLVKESTAILIALEHRKAKELQETDPKAARPIWNYVIAQYEDYIRTYPEDLNIDEQIFYLGDALYAVARYALAGQAYERIWEWPFDTEFREQSADNYLYAYQKAIDEQQEKGTLPKMDFTSIQMENIPKEPAQLPEYIQKYIQGVEKIMKLNKVSEDMPALVFQSAVMYLYYGHVKEGVERLKEMVKLYPIHPSSRVAAAAILQERVLAGDWEKVVLYAKTYREANVGGGKEEFLDIERKGKFKQASALYALAEANWQKGLTQEAKGQFKQVALDYQSILEQAPPEDMIDRVLYNIGAAYTRIHDFDKAKAFFGRLANSYPKSPLAQAALWDMAAEYENTLDFGLAADTFMQFVKTYPEHEQRPDALLNAAILLEADSKPEPAAQIFEQFARQYPNKPESKEVWSRILGLYEKTKNKTQQTRILGEMVKILSQDQAGLDAVLEGYVRYADAISDSKEKQIYYQKAVDLFREKRSSLRAAYYAAKAQHALLAPQKEQFLKMTIAGKTGKIQAQELIDKGKALAKTQALYENVITKYGQADWAVASLYEIGGFYENFYNTLRKTPCPADVARIDEEACDVYADAIEEKAFAVSAKVGEFYELAYEKAQAAQVEPDLLFAIKVALNRIKPADYPIADAPLLMALKATEDVGRFLLDPLASPSSGADEWYQKGVDAQLKGQTEEAFLAYEDCLKQKPDHVWCAFNQVYLPLDETQREMIENRAKNDSNIYTESATPPMVLGLIALVKGQLVQAEPFVRLSMRLDPRSPASLALALRWLEESGRKDAADLILDHALKAWPEETVFLMAKAMGQKKEEQYAQAIATYEKISAKRSWDAGVYTTLGDLNFRERSYDKAEAYWEKALELKPNQDELNLNLGALFYMKKDYEKAKVYYAKIQNPASMPEFLFNQGLFFMAVEVPGMLLLERLEQAKDYLGRFSETAYDNPPLIQRVKEYINSLNQKMNFERMRQDREKQEKPAEPSVPKQEERDNANE